MPDRALSDAALSSQESSIEPDSRLCKAIGSVVSHRQADR
jgi:hypothetical protein